MKFKDKLGQEIPLKFCALIAERLEAGYNYIQASPLYDISRETAAAILGSAKELVQHRPTKYKRPLSGRWWLGVHKRKDGE